jgi:hypothetical protein
MDNITSGIGKKVMSAEERKKTEGLVGIPSRQTTCSEA